MSKGDDCRIRVREPDEDEEEAPVRSFRPPRRRQRRRYKNLCPPIQNAFAGLVGLIALGLVARFLEKGFIWFGVLLVLLFVTGSLILQVLPDLTQPELPMRIWEAGFAFVAFFVWLRAAPMGIGTARVYIENGSGQDVILMVDGRKWAEVKASDTATERLPCKPFELVTLEAGTRKELDRRWIDSVRGGQYLLNVLGANTYYEGSVSYRPVRRGNMPMPLPFPGEGGGTRPSSPTKAVWINANVDYLFEMPPSVIHGGMSRSYLSRTPLF